MEGCREKINLIHDMLGLRRPRGIWVQLLSIIVKSAVKILVGFCRAGASHLRPVNSAHR